MKQTAEHVVAPIRSGKVTLSNESGGENGYVDVHSDFGLTYMDLYQSRELPVNTQLINGKDEFVDVLNLNETTRVKVAFGRFGC